MYCPVFYAKSEKSYVENIKCNLQRMSRPFSLAIHQKNNVWKYTKNVSHAI